MKLPACLTFTLFVSLGSLGFSQPALLTEQVFPELQPILAAALQQSPRMIEHNFDLEAAAGDLIQARAGLYPSAGASFQESTTRDKREDLAGTLSTEKLYYSVSLNQPLFYWGDLRNRAKIGEIREKIVHKQYVQAYTLLAQEIRGTYLRLILNKAQLQAAVYSQQQSEQALKLAEDRLRNRVISDADIFYPRIAVQQATLSSDRARDSFADSKRAFVLLTGTPAPADDAIPGNIARITVPVGEADRLLAGFLSQPEIKTFATETLKAQLEIERLNYAIARTALWPKFSLVLGVSEDQQSYSANIGAKYGVQSRYIGISGNWAIFDGFAMKGAKKSTMAHVRKLEMNYKQLTDSLGTDAQRAARQLSFAEREMAIQDQLMDSATTFLQYRKNEFSRGTVSETDVAAVQTVYNQKLVETIQTRSVYLLKYSDFLALIMKDPALNNVPTRLR